MFFLPPELGKHSFIRSPLIPSNFRMARYHTARAKKNDPFNPPEAA
jgi:hypothetical protein